jgi:2-succinyl-6-hydroxy-2,4-cyclohexadiene-1-carboxylate synthase
MAATVARLIVLLHGLAQPPTAWGDTLAAWPGGAPAAIELEAPAAPAWDAALDELGGQVARHAHRPIAIGYSQGARLALGLLSRDLVAAAALVSVNPGLPAGDDDGRAARRAADRRWAHLVRTRGMTAFLDAWEAQPVLASAAAVDPERRRSRRRSREALDPEIVARSFEAIGLAEMPDLSDALVARADRVHLVVGGTDDKFVAIARALAARAPGLVVDVVAGSGHDPTLDAPGPLAAALARAAARFARRST